MKYLNFVYVLLIFLYFNGYPWGWISRNSGTQTNLHSLFFLNPETVWTVGAAGTILITFDGGIIGIDENIQVDLVPQQYYLSQNYANPFNPSTTITYEIPHSGVVNLKVFDVLGREVETLVNAYQVANKYSVTFNAAQYPSGIYFYTLLTKNWAETKKMLLVR